MTNDLKTIQQSILLYLLYKISVEFNQAKILKCKMGLVPWLNWLIFHLQVLAIWTLVHVPAAPLKPLLTA